MPKIASQTLASQLLGFTVLLLTSASALAQVGYSANDLVEPYQLGFHPAANIGEYTAFDEEQLALLVAGGNVPNANNSHVMGAGVKALRPGIFEAYVEAAGYDALQPVFVKYNSLGMGEHTAIVGFPSPAHQDPTEYCPGIQSTLFANMYTPIWDGGANGTPYNDTNYYAAYMYKVVSQYKDHVRFWEIWNEPGFDYTGGLGYLEPGAPGSWWDNNPNPCDYKLRAPIFHYVRLLRISWEVVNTVAPETYVVVSGTGYPSFLDAILRNTDNPVDGSVTADFPLKGGAYFDVMGFHSYPHFDGGLREYSNAINDFVYYRHSDAASQALLRSKNIYQAVLDDYGYDGQTYPQKHWIITEINLPRKEFPDPSDPGQNFIGSGLAQRNFVIKAMIVCMANGIQQMQVYKLAEDTGFENAYSEFDLMGLYQRLDYNHGYFQPLNDLGVAHKTASDQLFGKTYDPVRTAALQLPSQVGGAALIDEHGNHSYVLWAKTQADMSESASATYSFPTDLNIGSLLRNDWDASLTHVAALSPSVNIALTATPIFLTETQFSVSDYDLCPGEMCQLTSLVPGATQWQWTAHFPDGSNQDFATQTISLTAPNLTGYIEVDLIARGAAGQTLGVQQQKLWLTQPPAPAFGQTVTGPIAYFQNATPVGQHSFVWQFGDGQTSTDPVPTHVYYQSGTFNVTLTATNQCGTASATGQLQVISPSTSLVDFTANDSIPTYEGTFRPSTFWDYIPGWQSDQLADVAAGNPLVQGAKGAGVKALRSFTGEKAFNELGYDFRLDDFEHFSNLDLRENSFLLTFPDVPSRDTILYCPERQSNLFRDLYLDIWDGGENGTPVNEANPFASYIWNTVSTYRDYVRFWEIYNSPDFDRTGDKAWLPPGQPGNWWENNPDPCDTELGAPVFYYIRSLRIAYEVVHYLDPDGYVTLPGLAYPSFLDAILRNTDNPLDGSVADPYPLRGGAYFDAVGFKSYPHFDGSTIYYDVNAGGFVQERHSDAAVAGIPKVKQKFATVLHNYGYDGSQLPEKEWIISEANLPRASFYGYIGSKAAQRNWVVKAWVQCVKEGIRQLNIQQLSEREPLWLATDPFQVMGLFEKMANITPYNQTPTDEAVALKTCSDLLFGADLDLERTASLALPDSLGGAAFKDANGEFIYMLWARTRNDFTEVANATYSFPASLGVGQLERLAWDYSATSQSSLVPSVNISLTGSPIFLRENATLAPPVAFFEADLTEFCAGGSVQFTSHATGNPTVWEWTFEGGSPASFIGENPPAITYPAGGEYEVKLRVSNAAGEHTATYSSYLEVLPSANADFTFSISGADVQFVNLSDDPLGLYGTDFEWCFGDGICQLAANPIHTYAQNGTYMVTLTATNDCGTATYEYTLTIGAPPTAVYGYTHDGGCATPKVQFYDLSYSNPESWHWFFPGASPSEFVGPYPQVTFPQGGVYEVIFVVGNSIGNDTLVQNLYIEGNITVEQVLTVCEGGIYEGQTIFSDTTITSLLATTELGCDSTVLTHITVADVIETTDQLGFCVGDWYNGMQLFSDTVIVTTTPLPAGCDSISTTILTVFPNAATAISDTISPGQFVQIGDEFFTEPGVYEVVLQTWQGCDSIVTLTLVGATGTSQTLSTSLNVKVFPNPFDQQLWVEFELEHRAAVGFSLFDALGRRVGPVIAEGNLGAGLHKIGLDVRDLVPGVYWLSGRVGEGSFTQKLVKIR